MYIADRVMLCGYKTKTLGTTHKCTHCSRSVHDTLGILKQQHAGEIRQDASRVRVTVVGETEHTEAAMLALRQRTEDVRGIASHSTTPAQPCGFYNCETSSPVITNYDY